MTASMSSCIRWPRAEPKGQVEVRLISRSNEILATKRTDAVGRVALRGRPGARRGRAFARHAGRDRSQGRLRVPQSEGAGVRSDRPRRRRARPAAAGLDAFVYTERGVYRSGETVHVTALLRDAQGAAALDVPLTLVVERPDGVEYRRVAVPDQGVGGRSLERADQRGGADRHLARARLHRSEAPGGRRDDLPGRGLCAGPSGIRSCRARRQDLPQRTPAEVDGRRPLSLRRAGLRARPRRRGRDRGGQGAAGLRRLSVRPRRRGGRRRRASRSKTCRTTDDKGKASFQVTLDKVPAATRPLEAQVIVRMAEAGGRAVERKLTLPITPTASMIGVKPLFSGSSLGEGENANFDVVLVAPDGKTLARKRPALRTAARSSRAISGIAATAAGTTSRSSRPRRIADGTIDVARRQAGPHLGAGAVGPLSPRSLDRRRRRPADLGRLRRRLVCRSERRYAGPARNRARQAGIPARRHHECRGDRAHRRHASRST